MLALAMLDLVPLNRFITIGRICLKSPQSCVEMPPIGVMAPLMSCSPKLPRRYVDKTNFSYGLVISFHNRLVKMFFFPLFLSKNS